ncbi:MAG: citrate/2-methylcitrate synthase [Oscillospiraceae bacterium]
MATLLETDIAHLSENIAQQYAIPAQYFEDQSIKRGLRNADGTGVLIGVSKVGSVQGYYMMDGERVPMPGKLYYRGISVEDIVEAHRKSGTFGYEEVAYLLLLGYSAHAGAAAALQRRHGPRTHACPPGSPRT